MDEEAKTSAPEKPEEEKKENDSPKGKKVVLILVFFLFLAAIAGGAYWFGLQGKEEPSPSPSPTETPTINEDEPEPSPTAEGEEASPTPIASPTPSTQTMTLDSIVALDGFRASNNGGNKDNNIRAGRNTFLVSRGFVSFDLSSIPSGATITKATLRIYQYDIIGNPYGVGSRVMLDHLDYGDSLGSEDYGASSLSSSFATLTSNSTIEWKDAEVTDQIQNDLENARSRSQYRLHFAIETIGGTAQGDFAYFESAEDTGGTGNTPQLVIEYF